MAKLLNFVNHTIFELNDDSLIAMKLFNFLLKYSGENLQQKNFLTIQNLYFQSVDYLLNIMDHFYLERMRIACCISISIAK